MCYLSLWQDADNEVLKKDGILMQSLSSKIDKDIWDDTTLLDP